mmetsp:Transcript_10451/g.16039  ORF Transcript_10451/g.16039 Transcript_10451/m.16039 type:complete len:311 (-) Transcript_10451:244-1176(-)|eukprot:CAMPEP_0178938158 /NCGR_PEP_ID=MMETSP0786-20121207/26176_1 /TAXON_ID=186022 /ORGANISM="Thalassionema frauenfeldii, Strain CCMP 1798" /LENGTH=310 /DNA_ID=CAMNT_0020616847 /DNA_START=14 /DNA_END=946 /DNA_ORIENTATION=-
MARSNNANKLTILTYNVGLLRVRTIGVTLFSNPDFIPERLEHLPKSLLSSGADILALQEIYEKKHVSNLLKEVKEVYPYHARVESHWPWQKSNGLLILSKFPLTDIGLMKHRRGPWLESLMGSKAIIFCRVTGTACGDISLVNLHTTAGGTDDPESDATNKFRESQLKEAIDFLEKGSHDGDRKVLIGDLNMSKEVSSCNYEYLCNSGYTDLVHHAEELPPKTTTNDNENSDEPFVTWDPENILNKRGPHAKCPGQRCDHVFAEESSNLYVKKAYPMFTDAFIECPKEENLKVTLSDHYGIQVEIFAKTE